MVRAKAKTRAAQAAALMLSIPVMAHAMTVMDRMPLPVPRPTWLDALPAEEILETNAPETGHLQMAALPEQMPLPIARPAWLIARDAKASISQDHVDGETHVASMHVASMPAPAPLPIPRPAFLDPLPADEDNDLTSIARQETDEAPAPRAASPLHSMIDDYARRHGVPERLAHRIVQQESRYNPVLKSKAHYGLMQVSLPTAKSMGYAGDGTGLLDAKTNLTYAMPYLANAWIISGGSEEKARRLYMSGYYPEAKRKGLLKDLRKADSPPVAIAVEAADAR